MSKMREAVAMERVVVKRVRNHEEANMDTQKD